MSTQIMPSHLITTPVTPPPDLSTFTPIKSKSLPINLTKEESPSYSKNSEKMSSLKRKAEDDLRGPSTRQHVQNTQTHQASAPLGNGIGYPALTPFPPSMPAHGVMRDPLAAFVALGLIPSTMITSSAAHEGMTFAAWQQQQQQQQQQRQNTASTSTQSTKTTSTATAAATASTSPSLSDGPMSPGSSRPSPTQTQTQAQTNSQAQRDNTEMPIPMSMPLQLPTNGLLGNLPTDTAKFNMTISRIAAFYQQRCQAIASFQHQKCQAWATVQRQKCQETMQAAMLVVAWYVRDRILRRRRKMKRRFAKGKRALDREGRKVPRKERVGTWLQGVEAGLEPKEEKRILEQEVGESESESDRDSKLLEVADNLIRSQYRKVEVPLLGLLNFDESSEDDDEDEENEMEREFEEEEEEDDDEDFEDIEEDIRLSLEEEKRAKMRLRA